MHRGELLSWHLWHVTSCYLHYRLPRFGAIPAEQRGDITTMCVLVSTCDMCHTVTRIKGTFKCVRSIQKRQCTRKLRMASFSSFHLSSYKITVNVDILRLVSLCFYHSRVHIPAHNKLYKPLSSLIKIISFSNPNWKARVIFGIRNCPPRVLHFTLQTVSKTRFNALSFVFPSLENCPNLCSTKDPIAGLVSPRARRDLAKFRHNIKKSPSWLMERYF